MRIDLISPYSASSSFNAPQPINSRSSQALQNVMSGLRSPSRLIACAGFESYACAWWEMYLNDLHRLRHFWRRDVSSDVAGVWVLPLRLVLTAGHRAAGRLSGRLRRIKQRRQRDVQTRGKFLQDYRGRAAFTTFNE